MAGSVDKIKVILLTLVEVLHLYRMALDGYALLLLQIHIIKDLVLHLPVGKCLGQFQKTVSQGTLAMVNVRYYAEIPYVLHPQIVYKNANIRIFRKRSVKDLSLRLPERESDKEKAYAGMPKTTSSTKIANGNNGISFKCPDNKMKKHFLTIVLLLAAAFVSSAQGNYGFRGSLSDFYSRGESEEPAGHMYFEGVEINGSLQSCMGRLKDVLKFKPSHKDKTEPFMEGNYGKEKVEIRLGTVPGHDLVYMFVVTYPRRTSWAALSTLYESVKMKLTLKYGSPVGTDENNPPEYLAVFDTPEGDITLSTTEEGYLRIYFQDKINLELARHETYN